MKDHHKKESPILTLPSLAGGFTGSAAETYWLATYGGAGFEGDETSYRENPVMAVSSSGDIYIATGSYSTDNNGVSGGNILAKYNKKGVIQWQRKTLCGTGSYSGNIAAVATDSSDNVYITGSTYNYFSGSGSHGDNVFLVKYNSSGTVQWARMAGSTSGGWNQHVHAMDIDSSDNIWIAASDNQLGQAYNKTHILIIQYNSSGTHQFSRHIGQPQSWPHRHIIPVSIAVGSDRYTICGHFTDQSNTDFRMFVYSARISNHTYTSPSKEIKGQYLGNQNQWYGKGVAHDSSGNIYIVGNSRSTNANHVILFKYYDAGGYYDKAWQQFLVYQSARIEARDIKIDGDDNIYIMGYSTNDSNPYSQSSSMKRYVIAKYNSSGTLQWSRAMGTLITYNQGLNAYYYLDNDWGLSLDILDDNVYFAGRTQCGGGHGSSPSANNNNSYDVLFAKVPNDGSLAGYSGGGTAGTYNHNTNRAVPQIPIYYYDGGYTSSAMNTYEVISSLPFYNTSGYDASSYITSANVTPTVTTMDYDSYTTPME